MASIINALSSGTGGIVTSGDASGILQLQTANTAAVTIDGSQNVGIGTLSPSNKLTVKTADGAGIAIQNAAGTEYRWAVNLDNSFSAVNTGVAERLRINTTGNLVLQGGTVAASGTGITFPATQSASSDANSLDDYEEGTWSPSIGGNATYSNQSGTYTKVGRMVTCNFDLTINVIGSGSTTSINNFPFANGSTTAMCGTISYYVNIATATNFISIYLNGSTTTTNCTGNTASATNVGLNGFAVFGNSTRLIGSITYPTST